jgi:hypothetical protein
MRELFMRLGQCVQSARARVPIRARGSSAADVRIGFHCSMHKTMTREMRADEVVFDPR